MAHGWLNHAKKLFNLDIEVFSAGVETHGLNPRAVEVMKEDGIDISHHQSSLIDDYMNTGISHVITVCDHAAEQCPIFSEAVEKTHHNFSDPSKLADQGNEVLPAYRKTRNEIRDFVFSYIQQIR